MIAIQCALGRRELPAFAERADVVAGVSAYNAAELGSDVVIPILFDPERLGPSPATPTDSGPLLFVGRLAPHKRQDELIRLVALLRRHRLPDAELVLVGEPLNPAYLARLRELADAVAPGAVTFEHSLPVEALARRYVTAGLFVSLSEHEGFCIPLLEAFHMELPVVARPSGGVPEVAGDGALLTDERDPAVLAELVALALEDGGLRATLRERGRFRVPQYAPERTEQAMRAALELLS
jgi:glycosyltransferase involved in cell wall biosynthesis